MLGLNYDSFELSIQTSDINDVGQYKLMLTSFLEPGPWSFKQYPINLTIINPCELKYFNFGDNMFGEIAYTLTQP